jgi:RluA family pseudouridine synthase
VSESRPPRPPRTSDAGGDDRTVIVPNAAHGERLDRFLVRCFPGQSRRRLMAVVKAGLVRVDGRETRPGESLSGGERVTLPPLDAAATRVREQQQAGAGVRTREVVELHRDEELLVVSKPPGVPCHGGAGLGVRRTLLELLKADVLAGFGLVHRIDQDTSGVVVLARGDLKRALTAAFAEEGAIEKVYDALVEGVPKPPAGEVDLPLADPGHGTRGRVDRQGKPARTEYSVTEDLRTAARVRAVPRTGRTHQIRLHLAALGTPLLVDPLYGRRGGWRLVDPKGGPAARLSRTPLHAAEISFVDPRSGERRTFRAPLLADHRRALEVLRVAAARGGATRSHDAVDAGPAVERDPDDA